MVAVTLVWVKFPLKSPWPCATVYFTFSDVILDNMKGQYQVTLEHNQMNLHTSMDLKVTVKYWFVITGW